MQRTDLDIPFPAVILLALLMAHPSSNAQTALPLYIGTFSNVVKSSQSGDCSGLSVSLWSIDKNSVTETVAGTLDLADGPCRGTAVPLIRVKYDARSGNLQFDAPSTSFLQGELFQFNGKLTSKRLSGSFTINNNLDTKPYKNTEGVDLPLQAVP